jgi:hypothetical protein
VAPVVIFSGAEGVIFSGAEGAIFSGAEGAIFSGAEGAIFSGAEGKKSVDPNAGFIIEHASALSNLSFWVDA